jgi:hypothetical protein
MTPLRRAATDYLALRRALGFKLRANEDALIEFTDFLDGRGVTTITAAAARRVGPEQTIHASWLRRRSAPSNSRLHAPPPVA